MQSRIAETFDPNRTLTFKEYVCERSEQTYELRDEPQIPIKRLVWDRNRLGHPGGAGGG